MLMHEQHLFEHKQIASMQFTQYLLLGTPYKITSNN